VAGEACELWPNFNENHRKSPGNGVKVGQKMQNLRILAKVQRKSQAKSWKWGKSWPKNAAV
jgi:hypothetical protein